MPLTACPSCGLTTTHQLGCPSLRETPVDPRIAGAGDAYAAVRPARLVAAPPGIPLDPVAPYPGDPHLVSIRLEWADPTPDADGAFDHVAEVRWPHVPRAGDLVQTPAGNRPVRMVTWMQDGSVRVALR